MATAESKNRYFEAVGRRKRAIARVRVTPHSKQVIVVNGKTMDAYFPVQEHQNLVEQGLQPIKDAKFSVEAKVKGGGVPSQAEAIRLGIARALTEVDESYRGLLKEEGYLRRDPRVKERKKFGLRKARRAPQWSKR